MVLKHRQAMKVQYKICVISTQAWRYQLSGDIKFESVLADRLFYVRFSVLPPFNPCEFSGKVKIKVKFTYNRPRKPRGEVDV
jgi:hypothetical protein